MAVFPKIDSPCPYKSQIASVMEGDFCRMCRRQVVDLTAMDDGERLTFLKGCEGEVCVSYRLPVRLAMAAALAVASVGAPMAAAACEDVTAVDTLVMGGIKDPAHTQLVEDKADQSIPAMRVVYDEPDRQREAPAAATGGNSAAADQVAPPAVRTPAAS